MTDVVGARGREVREVDVGAGEERRKWVKVCVCVCVWLEVDVMWWWNDELYVELCREG